MLASDKVEKISYEIIRILYRKFNDFPENADNNRNAPFHKAFLNAFTNELQGFGTEVPFFISLSSWLHGLNTTLGQSFFEKVAHILCDGCKREYTSGRMGNLYISTKQQEEISKIITDLSNDEGIPDLLRENALLFDNNDNRNDLIKAMNFSADIFIEDDTEIIAIELKSVRPNSGEMGGEKLKILQGKAALSREFPDKDIKFYIGFPFDPTNDSEDETGYDKKRFMNSIINMTKYFAEEETLLSSELWDFLSGDEDTMEDLLGIINSIATTEFMDIYNYLDDNRNRNHTKYGEYLRQWNLDKELNLLKNDEQIKKSISHNSSLTRKYNQPIFKKGSYNIDRYNDLEKLI